MKRAVLLALLVLTVVAPAVAPASPTPQPLCSVCDTSFERAAEEQGVGTTAGSTELSVVESTATVEVRTDETGRWTVRNRLGNQSTADRFRSDPSLLDSVVRTALEGHGRPDSHQVSDLSARVEGKTVVVTFTHSSFAQQSGAGVLLVDYLHDGGERRYYVFDADRFTIVGPEGSVVVNDPASGRVTDGSGQTPDVTWQNSDDEDDRGYGFDRSVEDTYVAFGPSEGVAQKAALQVALAGQALPVVLENLGLLVPALVVLVAGLAGLRAASRSGLTPQNPRRFAVGVLAVGLLAVANPFYAGSVPLINDDITALSAAGTVYLLVGGMALALASDGEIPPLDDIRERVRWWWLLAPATATPAVAAMLISLLSYPATPWEVHDGIWLGVPLAATFSLGYAVGSGEVSAKRHATLVTLGLVAGLTYKFVTFTEVPFAGTLLTILASALVVLGLLFSVPLYLLGDSLVQARSETNSKASSN